MGAPYDVRRRYRTAVSATVVLVLAGCSAIEGRGGRTSGPARGPQAEVAPKAFSGACRQREDDGSTDDARLRIVDDRVVDMQWLLTSGPKGATSCRFDLAAFEQVRSRPHIELVARNGSGCRLLTYHDQRRRTLAPLGCESFCRGEIDDDPLPVVFDPRTGDCAR